jgi:hypothetical protein
MHYTYFDGTRGVRGAEEEPDSTTARAEDRHVLPGRACQHMMSFAIDMAGDRGLSDGPTRHPGHLEPCTEGTAELPDFKDSRIHGQRRCRAQRGRMRPSASRRASAPSTAAAVYLQDKLVHDYDLWT